MDTKEIFNNIKEHNYDKIKEIILEKNFNLDIYDENNNYLIHYLIIFNKYDLLELVLKKKKYKNRYFR